MERNNLLAKLSFFLLSTLLITALGCLTAFGQAGTSTVRGTVTDPQGNVIAGATVNLINPATNTSPTETTTDIGAYSFEFLAAGDSRAKIEPKSHHKDVGTDGP